MGSIALRLTVAMKTVGICGSEVRCAGKSNIYKNNHVRRRYKGHRLSIACINKGRVACYAAIAPIRSCMLALCDWQTFSTPHYMYRTLYTTQPVLPSVFIFRHLFCGSLSVSSRSEDLMFCKREFCYFPSSYWPLNCPADVLENRGNLTELPFCVENSLNYTNLHQNLNAMPCNDINIWRTVFVRTLTILNVRRSVFSSSCTSLG